VRLRAAECSQLRRRLSLDDLNHQRGVTMSITVTMSAVQSHTPDVTQADVVQSPFTVVDDHRWCRKPHGSLPGSHWLERSSSRFSFLSHFARIQSSRSQYFTSTNHLLCGFYLHFYWRLASKALQLIWPPAD